jgi:cytochrome c2
MAEAAPPRYEPPKELESRAQTQKVQGRPKRSPQDQAEYFYEVRKTHIAFFLSSVALAVGFVLMFAKDTLRPWKPYQREFLNVEFEKLWYEMRRAQEQYLRDQDRLKSLDGRIEALLSHVRAAGKGGLELPADALKDVVAPVAGLEKAPVPGRVHVTVDEAKQKLVVAEKELIRGELYNKQQLYNFAKDEQGAVRYRFEESKHHFEDAVKSGSPRVAFYETHYEHAKRDWDRVNELVASRKADYDEVQKRSDFYSDLAGALESRPLKGYWERPLEDLKKERAALGRELEEKRARFGQEKPSEANTIRDLPMADFFAPRYKVKQVVLGDVKDQLNFARVDKVDRCMTCHVGIDNPKYAVWLRKDAEDETEKYVFKDPFLRKFVAHAQGHGEPKDCAVCDEKGRRDGEIKEPLTKHGAWGRQEAIKFTKAFMAHPRLDLFVGDASRHPMQKIGCTICHEGDGRDTDFTRVVHTPDSAKEGQDWRARHGTPYGDERYDWNYRELWDLPMFPSKYVQASCRRCHVDAVELDGGEKYVEGMKIVERAGCYGCHRIDTHMILPKDVNNPDTDPNRKQRRPGPPLTRIATKVTPDWAAKWILEPRGFRPTTRMPHFFKQSNLRTEVNGHAYPVTEAGGVKRSPVDDTIVASITKYVFGLSETRADPEPPGGAKGDAKRGELLVRQAGCTACHKVEETPLEVFLDTEKAKSVRSRFLEEFAPALAGVGSKMNRTWLWHWLRDPKKHFPDSQMGNLRLTEQEASDVVEFLMTLKKPDWERLPAPEADPKVVDDLLSEILRKKMSAADAREAVEGKSGRKDLKELSSAEGKVAFLGRFMVKNFGCYSCHAMKADEDPDRGRMSWIDEEGIGVELTGSQPFGSKHHDRLDFGFTAYDGVNHHGVKFKHGYSGEEVVAKVHENRHEWLEAKLRNPRVFDGAKMASKPWDELLRMPYFRFNEYEIERISTFVLSFTDHAAAGLVDGVRKRPSPDEAALYRGERIVRENNCQSCHRFELDRFEVQWSRLKDGRKVTTFEEVEGAFTKAWSDEEAVPFLKKWRLLDADAGAGDVKKAGMWVRSYNWAVDHRTLVHVGAVKPDNRFVAFDGRELWYLDTDEKGEPVRREVRRHRPQVGGGINPAIKALKKKMNEDSDEEFLDPGNEVEFESRYAPHLRGQGVKTQADWLYRFLRSPHPIRPTLAPIVAGGKALPDVNLRMPTFGFTEEEATALVRYFAARDHLPGVDVYPHTDFPERDPAYLATRKEAMDWAGAFLRDKEKGCSACHFVNGQPPPGAPIKFAPELSKVQDRIRPRWYGEWIRVPTEVYPGTAMAPLFAGKPEERENVKRLAEYLINYSTLNASAPAKAAEKK